MLANTQVLFKSMTQFSSQIDEIKLPKNINRGLAFLELLQLNLKKYEAAVESSELNYKHAQSDYEDSMNSIIRVVGQSLRC